MLVEGVQMISKNYRLLLCMQLIVLGVAVPAFAMDAAAKARFARGFAQAIRPDDEGSEWRRNGVAKNITDWIQQTNGVSALGIISLNGKTTLVNNPFEFMNSPEGRREMEASLAAQRARAAAKAQESKE
jgi:hypothetical protein